MPADLREVVRLHHRHHVDPGEPTRRPGPGAGRARVVAVNTPRQLSEDRLRHGAPRHVPRADEQDPHGPPDSLGFVRQPGSNPRPVARKPPLSKARPRPEFQAPAGDPWRSPSDSMARLRTHRSPRQRWRRRARRCGRWTGADPLSPSRSAGRSRATALTIAFHLLQEGTCGWDTPSLFAKWSRCFSDGSQGHLSELL